ncbi:hypothetical protein MBLNU230_g5818t1 [Neophaeotheca triangularis]
MTISASHASGMANMFLNSDFSDLTIKCDGEEFPVHKGIVCALSPVLSTLCKAKMRESQENIIEHMQFDAATVRRMLSFIYIQDYSLEGESVVIEPLENVPSKTSVLSKSEALIAHVHTFAIADYYDIPSLRYMATKRFIECASEGLQIQGFFQGFFDVVREVYRYAPNQEEAIRIGFRNVVLDNFHFLRNDAAFVKGLSEEGQMQSFAVELLVGFSQATGSLPALYQAYDVYST